MAKALSLDLRVRVLAAVARGVSHRQAGERFGVSAASVSRWRKLARERGEARAKALGGDRRSGRIDAHKTTILGVPEATPDITIEELRRTLADKGLIVGYGNKSAARSR
jgi:transposase